MSYQITEEQKKILLQYSAQTLPDNPSRDGFSAEAIRKRMYKPTEKLVDLVNAVFDTVYTDVQSILSDIQNGDFFARSIASWSASYNYGANEITFYPSIGTYGAFVQSVVAGNTNNAPYINGTINSAFWKEVVNFNTVTDDFFAEIKAVQIAAEAAQSAAETAQGKAEDAQAAAEEAESGAQTQAQAAASSATAAEESADAAESAKAAAQTAQNAAESAEGNAQAYAGQASGSANSASQSASAAAASANRAQEIVNGIGSVYKPVGSIAFSALPATPAAAQQGYVYNITDAFTTDARFVDGAGKEYPAGTNVAVVLNGSAYMYDALSGNVDLSNYAQTNGTYPNMSVGTASEAGYADAAASADTAGYATTAKGDASGNDIEATYATKEALTEGLAGKQPTGNYALQNGTYAGMTVGNATNAQNATKATKDASGNVITATYATKTENNAKYTKPSTGIPKSDLESSVQTSLSKADSALQSIPIATPSVVGGVKPVTKTSEMTQEVGVDSNGALWTKEASGGTTVIANPTATGTQDLNSLQVGGTVYNIPQGTGSDEPIIPTIGENGNWYVNGVDTGKPSRGADGQNGADGADGADGLPALAQTRSLSAQNITSPMAIPNEALNRAANVGESVVLFAKQQSDNKSYLIVGTIQSVGTSNPYTFIEFSEKTVITGADGKDGATPEIGENGNWFINGEDTGKPSRGEAAASSGGGIVAVDILPDPSELEYEKHLLYLKDTDLNYIVAKPSDEANVTIVSSLPYKLSSHNGAVSIGDCAYIFGTNNGTEYTKDIIKFDSVSKECTVLSCKMPKLIYYAMCASVGKNAYIFGGYDGTTVSYNIIKFDSETETFTTLSATTLQAKMQGAVFTIGNNIYIVAGKRTGTSSSKMVVLFDTESETATYVASFPEYVDFPIACSVGTNGYVFGADVTSHAYDIVKYDSVANTFTELSSKLPDKVHHGGIGRIGTNIYILGGCSSTNDSIIKFDSETETCTTLSVTLPSGRSYLHACNIGSDIYTFGGITAGSARTDEVLKFGFGYSYSYKKITATEV